MKDSVKQIVCLDGSLDVQNNGCGTISLSVVGGGGGGGGAAVSKDKVRAWYNSSITGVETFAETSPAVKAMLYLAYNENWSGEDITTMDLEIENNWFNITSAINNNSNDDGFYMFADPFMAILKSSLEVIE